jgi:hypothetical protein
MKKYSLAFILLFVIGSLAAQVIYRDVVYLKNGSVIRGKIVEEVPNKTYTIKTADSSLFVVQIEDIVKIVHEEIAGTSSGKKSGERSTALEKGYEGLAEFGYGAAVGKYGLDVAKFNLINGYRLNSSMFAGIGTGLRYFSTEDAGFSVIPLFLDFRYRLPNKEISPFAAFSAGYAWDGSHGFQDAGFLFNPQIGLQLNKHPDFMFHIGFGYEIQQMRFITGFNTYIIRFSEAASFNLGMTF